MDDRGLKGGRPRRPPVGDLEDVIYGIHAVEEALAAGETLRRIHLSDERRRDPALRPLLARAAERTVTVRFENRGFFTNFPYKAHQGVVAYGAPFDYAGVDDVLERHPAGRRLLVILDHVTDPHNLGAIIRTAECAGASGIVIPERRAAGVNGTVRKSAAGATAYLPVVRVANVAQTVRSLKKAGIWVAGAATGGDARPYTDADLSGDLALVVGAEGEGISPLVRRECDYVIAIPILGRTESLNASVAAGILLYEAVRQRTPVESS